MEASQTSPAPPSRNKTGRRTKLSPELIQEIETHLTSGLYFETACRLCGIEPRTGYLWMQAGRAISQDLTQGDSEGSNLRDDSSLPDDPQQALHFQFFQAVESAKAEAEARSVLAIREAGKTDWRAHSWYLERTRPDRYGAKERHIHEFSRSNDERLVAEAARLFGGAFAAAVGEALEVSPQTDNDDDTKADGL